MGLNSESGVNMVKFMQNLVTVIVVFFILSLTMAIFSPIVNKSLSGLVDDQIYKNQIASGNNGDVGYYYASLSSAKHLVLTFYNFSPYAISTMLLVWMTLSSLRKEQSDYPI